MTSISRRLFFAGCRGICLGDSRAWRLRVTGSASQRHSLSRNPPHWPDGLTLKAAVLADIHACEPWMPASRVRGIANLTNDLAPDIVFLLGDFSGGHRYVTGPVMPD